ncbi:MAG: type IV pilus secretin PilQ [Acidobacteriia bacterium]|nr:type IV pilus secretin PilQ [Terriglobia bacterium]
MRIMWRAWGLGVLLAAGLILSSGAVAATDAPVVHLNAVVREGGVQLVAQANGPFDYTIHRPTENLYVIDLSGVAAADPAGARVVSSDLVKSYRVMTYAAGDTPVARVEVLLSQGVEPRVERKDSQQLTLVVARVAKLSSLAGTSSAGGTPEAPKAVPAVKQGEAGPEAIQKVNLVQHGSQTEVSISGSGPLNYRSLRLRNPDRLVLDFSGSHLRTSEKHIPSNLDPVRAIRLAQFTPEVSRVVIDLREPAVYSIKREGNVVTVSFAPHGAARSTADIPAGTTTINAETPAMISRPESAAKPAEIPVPATALPATLTQTSAALASRAVQPGQQQAAVDARQMAEQASAAASTAPSASPQPAEVAPAAQSSAGESVRPSSAGAARPAGAARYSGEPISVNLKDVDLRDFFRLIHEISGLNVVIDPAVKGTVTIVLDDVPWDQALDIVMRNNSLDKQLDGNVLRIAMKQTIRKEAEDDRDLAKAKAEAADVITTTRVLSYAKATALAPTMKKFLSSRGDVIADDRSNTLIIRDIPSTLPVIDNLIRQLDRKARQVEIEARIVAASRSFSRDLGTQLAFAGVSGNHGISGAQGGTTSVPVAAPTPPIVLGSGAPGLATNLGAVSTSAVQYMFASPSFALDYVISAAESRGVGKLLSKPKVITQNNEKATVKQGTKIPIQTNVNNTIAIQFVDAVLELDVTPQITAEGTIFMDVTVQNDQIDQGIARINNTPALDTQSAVTRVTVADGATVVIGGIIVTNQHTQIDQVPFLGSVPILGNLFKHVAVTSSSQELLFFLTPRILPD